MSCKLRDKALPSLDVRPALANHKGRSPSENLRTFDVGGQWEGVETGIAIAIRKKSEVRFSFFPKLRPQKSEVDGVQQAVAIFR